MNNLNENKISKPRYYARREKHPDKAIKVLCIQSGQKRNSDWLIRAWLLPSKTFNRSFWLRITRTWNWHCCRIGLRYIHFGKSEGSSLPIRSRMHAKTSYLSHQRVRISVIFLNTMCWLIIKTMVPSHQGWSCTVISTVPDGYLSPSCQKTFFNVN